LRHKLAGITDRFAGFESQSLNVHVDFPLFQRMALPVTGRQNQNRRNQDSRHPDDATDGSTAARRHATQRMASPEIHQAILTTFGLTTSTYTLTQLRYDLCKMKAHGLLERIGRAYCYRLSDKGTKAALMFILFHHRVCGPPANSLFHHRPDETLKPPCKIETAFHKADQTIQQVLDLLAA
jgi:hypothetical protein